MFIFNRFVAARRRELFHTVLLVLCDVFAMYEALVLGCWLRASSAKPLAEPVSAWDFGLVALGVTPFLIVIFGLCGLYSVGLVGGRVSEAGRVVAAVFLGIVLLVAIDYETPGSNLFPSRAVPLFAFVLGVILTVALRQVVRSAMRRLFVSGRALHHVVVIGSGPLATSVVEGLLEPGSGYRIVGVVNPGARAGLSSVPQWAIAGVPVFGTVEDALDGLDHVDEVVQAEVGGDSVEVSRVIGLTIARGITYRFVPDRHDVHAASSKLGAINGVPVMEVRLTSLDGWGSVGKRVFDLVGALLLTMVFAPVMLALALLVKVTDPGGPVLYAQRRLGLGGREIKVYKFRTMRWDYCTGPERKYHTAEQAFIALGREDLLAEFAVNQKVADDPRVSRLGRFLRKTSLDELPQLVNAIRGDLSLVGPRPITQAELDRYGRQAVSFLALKPGITGLWQVYGRSNTTYEERVKLDIHYVENWTVGMDVSILARTLVSVAARKGAA